MKRNEAARHREQLKSNMLQHERSNGLLTPQNTDCHHIVSVNHSRARETRAILRQYGIDIDSHQNGVRLPENSNYVPHDDMPNAYSHKSIHTKTYYTNVTNQIVGLSNEPDINKDDIVALLREIAEDLVNGVFPI